MGGVRNYTDLVIWQKAMELGVEVYKLTQEYPKGEQFGLMAQTRGSSASVPANIAEGFGRNSKKEFARFLSIARGSLYELQTQLTIALRLVYIIPQTYERLFERTREIEAMEKSLYRKLTTPN